MSDTGALIIEVPDPPPSLQELDENQLDQGSAVAGLDDGNNDSEGSSSSEEG